MNKSHLKLFFKFAFVVALLYFLAQKGFISMNDTQRAFTQLDRLLPAVVAMLVTMCLGILRWQLLLRAQDIHMTWLRTAQLTMVGNFFNIALPGAVSGDFVKAFYIGREIEGQRARAFGSILFDRVAGLSALVLVAAGALLVGLDSFKETPLLRAVQVFVIGSAVAVIAFYTYLFVVREQHDPLLKAFRWLTVKVPKADSLTRIYLGIRHYHTRRFTVVMVLALSILIHLIVGWAALNFAFALGEDHLSLLQVYVIVPLGLLVTAVPIMPAGVGTGHAAFAYLFGKLDSLQGANVFTLFALTQILIGAMGGLIYLQFRSREPKPALNTADLGTA